MIENHVMTLDMSDGSPEYTTSTTKKKHTNRRYSHFIRAHRKTTMNFIQLTKTIYRTMNIIAVLKEVFISVLITAMRPLFNLLLKEESSYSIYPVIIYTLHSVLQVTPLQTAVFKIKSSNKNTWAR